MASASFMFSYTGCVGALDGVFHLTDYLLDQWEADLTAWSAEPRYSVRLDLLEWLEGHRLKYR
jgi:hypothetical protein